MSDATFVVAIIGGGIIAEQIATSLIERAFPLSSLRLLGDMDVIGESVEIEGRTIPVEPLSSAPRGVDLVFVTGESDWQERDIEALVIAGAAAIDCSGRYAREADVPLVVPEVNADLVTTDTERRIFASPDAVAIALSAVLAPLHRHAGVKRVVATCVEAVSDAGAAGIDELSRQTAQLLQGMGAEAEIFPARVSFNVLPLVGEVAPSGDTFAEEHSCWQVRRVLELSELPMTLTRVRVPVFFGTGIALNVELDTPMDVAEAAEVLRVAPGLLATEAEEEADLSLADAVGQDATMVSRVRQDHSADNALNLWIALDNTRKGCAVNAVQIAELLLR